MANIQIGKYKRPGIFIEEFDRSIISTPTVDGTTNLVLGCSKKGTFNSAIRLTSVSELEEVFGPLDRNLERKGSYFHRTIAKMLEISPVFAINLLPTDDELDRVEFKPLSTSSGEKNSEMQDGPYRRFFDTTGFWKRDTDSFINLSKSIVGVDNEKIFNITNLSDRPISVFIFKTTITGFDRPMIDWYGSSDKIPLYVKQEDFASDYMVDVLVVAGDWSNYQELSVNPRWGNYFSPTGLRKTEVRNFANDRNVSLINFYEGLSFIPFFRDTNGRNIFIETVINRDTDRTGLFCSFNNDIVETDFYNGKIDLLGNNIVGKNETNIEFLSYREKIAEELISNAKPLDTPGNVFAMFGGDEFGYDNQNPHVFGDEPKISGNIENYNRTAYFAENSVYNFSLDVNNTDTTSVGQIKITYDKDVPNKTAFAVIGGQIIEIEGKFEFTTFPGDYVVEGEYTIAFVIQANGEIRAITGAVNTGPPKVGPTDIVLGYLEFGVNGGIFNAEPFEDISVNGDGFYDMDSILDYSVTQQGTDGIKITFLQTADQVPNTGEYLLYRRFKFFNNLVSILTSPRVRRACMLGDDDEKISLENVNITVNNNQSENRSITITGLDINKINNTVLGIDNGRIIIYLNDDEFLTGNSGLKTKNTVGLSTEGVVGRFSNFYTSFFDGVINTRDFFYKNRLYSDSSGIENGLVGLETEVIFFKNNGNDYIGFKVDNQNFAFETGLTSGEQIIIPNSTLNTGVIEIISDVEAVPENTGYSEYKVNRSVTDETLTTNTIYNANPDGKVYLKMYIDTSLGLNVKFRSDVNLEIPQTIDKGADSNFIVQSRRSNFKQTIEIEEFENYEETPNKILINTDRYTEVKIGDFLEADYSGELEEGEVPRKLTRILSKRLFREDPTLSEIVCDSAIKKYEFNNDGTKDRQTMRYLSIDNYANTYKSITLRGFRVRNESLPDGTEERQNKILNVVAKGTPLFKAITNKEAIDFRYLIDSFGLGLTERSKQQLVDICGHRLDVFGFINMPSIKSFKNSSHLPHLWIERGF
jgi:hypothetical protein